MFKDFEKWAEENGWKITKKESRNFPQNILDRYSVIPEGWTEFISDCELCTNQNETMWFLTPDDYLPKGDEEWIYNEFEQISIQASDSIETTAEIRDFWNRHLPILLSVQNGYEYYAIDTKTGNIVNGYEPEFEDVTVVAETFRDFVNDIIDGKILL